MIKGIGTDLIEIDRIARVCGEYGQRFLERLFTEAERAYFARWTDAAPSIAGRFAAKEAVMKALGTGWGRGVRFCDIEIERRPSGRPNVVLHGRCRDIFRELGGSQIHCTITHSRTHAMAVVIFE